ncbi:MAG TPA: hypothetical protein VMM12_14280 [Longimicrobiales bacterium]|nr:hypothetical protein [Longimicrobiales bacterium]
MAGVDLVGWCATAVFVGSYFFSKPETLRRVQVAGALLWMVYGILLEATPVIAANLLVVTAAAWTAHRGSGRGAAAGPGRPESPASPGSESR